MADATARQAYRGRSLGLPATGPGSLAPTGRRLLAFLIDLVAAVLVAGIFVHHGGHSLADRLPGQWSVLPWALDYLLGLVLLGRSFGMYLTGLRVIRVDAARPIGPGRALARTALLGLLIPGLMVDSDLRGLQDRLTATAVIVH
jgi:uncharacterized RDD family membrane protein YckC